MRHQDPMSADKPGPSKGEAYGMAAVTQALQGTEFPASKQDLMKRAGNQEISWTKGGRKMRLADLIEQAPSDRFPTMAQVISAISQAAHRMGT